MLLMTESQSYTLIRICFFSMELSFLGANSNQQGLDVESKKVEEAERYHSWLDTPIPNKTDEILHCHGAAAIFNITVKYV
jgi:hypothetical protein